MNFTKIKNGFLKCFFCDLECAAIQAKRSPIPLVLKLEKAEELSNFYEPKGLLVM